MGSKILSWKVTQNSMKTARAFCCKVWKSHACATVKIILSISLPVFMYLHYNHIDVPCRVGRRKHKEKGFLCSTPHCKMQYIEMPT